MGESDLSLQKRAVCGAEPIQVDTFGGRLHVEWNTDSSATPIGQLAFFAEFLKNAAVFDDWVDASQGWKAVEDGIKLAGWEGTRRVVILRRPVSGQSQLYLTPMNAAGRTIAAMITTIRAGLRHVKHIAEQLPSRDRWELSESSTCWLARYIVDRILASTRAIRRNQPALPAMAAG